MSTNAPPKVQDPSTPKEQSSSKEMNMPMNMGKEQISKAQDAASEIKHDMANTAQTMRDLVKDLTEVTTHGSEEILKIQSGACVESVSEGLHGLSPSVASTSPMSLLWDFPHHYQTQSERIVKAMLNCWSVLARIQQQQLELLGPTLHRNIETTTHTITQLNEVLANRRGTSTVLNFSERRKTSSMAQPPSREQAHEVAGAAAEQGHGGSQRAGRQAAG
ncbi:MAG: hypothetical protein A3F78_07230 [Burkholderiales bacterium RIFCSPLOWO2_12_FULL_61_40]|nr:MAG: hypothetical protein A3F78_07230 [Burkholderiales bacterium RIFCSPLOWO2_12_FULL_61_40]